MELYQLRYFQMLCKCEHFSRASEALYITRSTLTKAVKQLETELGQQLVDRSSSKFVLTEAGQILKKRSEQILNSVDIIFDEFETLANKKVLSTVAIDRAICTTDLIVHIAKFAERNPDSDVWVIRRNSSNLTFNLENGIINFGIMVKPKIANERLEYIKFRTVEYGLFFNRNNPLANLECISPYILQEKQIGIVNLLGDLSDTIEQYFSQFNIELTKCAVMDADVDGAKQIADSGLGMAILPLNMINYRDNLEARAFQPPLYVEYVFVKPNFIPLNSTSNRLITDLITDYTSIQYSSELCKRGENK